MSIEKKRHIAIIGSVGLPARYGGFETLTQELVKHLQGVYTFTVFCSTTAYPGTNRPRYWQQARLRYIPLPANGIGSILYDFISMLYALFFADTLLVLGVSGCIFLPIIKFLSRKQIIVNLDGVEWRRQKWSGFAKWYLKTAEYFAIRFADQLIADNEAIRKEVSQRYGRNPVTIAYGGDQAYFVPIQDKDLDTYSFLNKPYACKVCRIEPENNIESVLDAFSQNHDFPLVLIGNWQHSPWSKTLYQHYHKQDHLHLLDPIYDTAELNLIRSNASLYIHGHQAGGTNPSLVEAMSLGLPVLAFDVAYNRETTENKARFFQTPDSLAGSIETTHSHDWESIGEDMRSIAQRRYTWANISKAYGHLFEGSAVSQTILETV